MRTSLKPLLTLATWAMLSVASLAQVPPWPSHTVRLIVPFPAGGATDLVARTVAQRVSANTGQQVLVDNKAGAGGTLGSAEAARATADGYTLLLTTSSTHAIAPHLSPRLAYNAVADFTPIAHLADAASLLLVTPKLEARSVAELLALARKNPGALNYATSGPGTIVHLTTEAFATQAGLALTHVPYKGTALAMPDLIAGHVQILFDAIPSGMPHVKEGRVRALAVTGPRRSALAPELPTLAEAGLPGFQSVTWFGLYAPKGMEPELVRRVHAEFAKALQSAEVVERLARLGAEAARATGTPAEFAAMVAADSARWGQLIRDRRITLE